MFDAADATFLRAGEGARLVAEKLAFDDAFRQRAAVQRHEMAFGAAAPAVQQAGDDLLAAAGFTAHQHIHIRIGNLAQHLAQADDRRRLADQRHVVGLGPVGGGAQAAVFQHQTALFAGPLDALHQPFGRKGLGDEIIDAALDRLHGHGNIAMAGDQHDRQIGILRLQPAEQFQPVHARHADIGDDDAGIIGRDGQQRRRTGADGIDGETGQHQRLGGGAAQVHVVVHQEHAVHGGGVVGLAALHSRPVGHGVASPGMVAVGGAARSSRKVVPCPLLSA